MIIKLNSKITVASEITVQKQKDGLTGWAESIKISGAVYSLLSNKMPNKYIPIN